MERKHSLGNTVRHSAAASKQVEIHHRLMGLVRKCHLLIPSLRGTSIEPEEERLRSQLESLEAEIEGTVGPGAQAGAIARPGTAVRLHAKINELWAQIGMLKAKRDAMNRAAGGSGQAVPGSIEWAVVDQDSLDQVAKVSTLTHCPRCE